MAKVFVMALLCVASLTAAFAVEWHRVEMVAHGCGAFNTQTGEFYAVKRN